MSEEEEESDEDEDEDDEDDEDEDDEEPLVELADSELVLRICGVSWPLLEELGALRW